MKDITKKYQPNLDQRVLEIVSQFPTKKVLEAGDVMLDWTIAGRGERISPEAVAIVVLASSRNFSFRPGGAANIVRNFRSLGAKASLWGVIDEEDPTSFDRRIPFGYILKKTLYDEQIEWIGETDPDRETTVKIRVEASHAHTAYQQLVRVDLESHDPYLPKNPAGLKNSYDAFHIGDYNKGAVTPELVQILREEGAANKAPLVVDPKMGKNRDYHALYSNVTAITPNDLELAELTGKKFHEEDSETIAQIASDYAKELNTDVIVTRGRFGCTVCLKDGLIAHLKTLEIDVPDVTGAGDTFGAAYTLALACGASQIEAAHLAVITSFLVVHKKGTACVMNDELVVEIKRRIKEKLYPFD